MQWNESLVPDDCGLILCMSLWVTLLYLSASNLASRWQVESFVSILTLLYMALQTDLHKWERMTQRHSAGQQLAAPPLMPKGQTNERVIPVPNPLGGTDEKPNYKYCQYISPALAHKNKCCTCWDYKRAVVAQD
jgi:hypothetical protein